MANRSNTTRQDARSPARSETRIRVRERPAIHLTDEEKSTLNLATRVSTRTIEYWAAGYRVSRTNALRLEEAMDRRGIERRPKPSRAA
jgi:hypothetical protein